MYQALAYDDLAAFDAFVVYNLCQKELSDEFVTDLEGHGLDYAPWPPRVNDTLDIKYVRQLKIEALDVLISCLAQLGATRDAKVMLAELRREQELLNLPDMSSTSHEILTTCRDSFFGYSRREFFPWSTYEPDRNSDQSTKEINQYLSGISSAVEAKVTALPAFDATGAANGQVSYQLGLFAKAELQPGSEIFAEKSLLTAIRPLEDAICDACGQELEDIPFEEIRQCGGDNCDISFCSDDCKTRAASEYHHQLIEQEENEEDDDDPTYSTDGSADSQADGAEFSAATATQEKAKRAPFCGNEDLNTIGRLTTTDTPEWDLYFLLLTRTIAMSVTQKVHPLQLIETRYLWGDFNAFQSPFLHTPVKRTLPFSFVHNLQYVLDYFSTLSLSDPSSAPYSAHWLQNFDFWILQTLFAKFRGVANATQSTFDGKPEIASVHPGWSLANHSCAPNVRWTPKGVRRFVVRTKEERTWEEDREQRTEWKGIEAGGEIFSHYTDIRLPVRERRDRLRGVLGGDCHCKRCIREATAGS